MYALVDATSMYASCEKIFDPSIRNKPVVVLTNNDGCICAACPIAKKRGVGKKFLPYFQVKAQLEKAGTVVRSSNYELYADISQKMMITCERFAPETYIYSIDELFMRYPDNNFTIDDWTNMAKVIRRAVWKEVRLPVGVGIGPTPTLAKAASHASKRIEGFKGVAVINNTESRRYILENMSVTDIWGIGNRIGIKLNGLGINNAWQLSIQDPTKMRKYFSILVENTVRELNGEVRISWDDVRSPKKEIYSTRSFGQRVTSKDQLRFSLATHAGIVSSKLRQQGSLASGVSVFVQSSPHESEPFYRKNIYIPFPTPTQDTRVITEASSRALETLYKPYVRFAKSGVGVMDLRPAENYQEDLFTPSKDNVKLMTCLDSINNRFGRGKASMGATGRVREFSMRRDFLSPQYTTNWLHIPRIKC
jgi:DNA polymerase V